MVPVKVSIVVRAHNEAEHIGRLMLGIDAQTLSPHEVILVDSGSTDDTVEIALAHGAQLVTIDRSEFTFGRALNRGCKAATGDVFVFASGHVYPIRDTWLRKLVEPFEDDRVVLSYGRQRGDERTRFSEHRLFAQWFPRRSSCPQDTYFCNNANCAIRRSAWETLPYDESLTGLEDLAWAKTAQERGGWLAYVADADVAHVHEETWQEVEDRYRREAIAMRAIDPESSFTRSDFTRLLLRHVLSDIYAAQRQGRRITEELRSILMFRYRQHLGTYRGFNGPSQVSADLRARFYYPGETVGANVEIDGRDVIDYPALEAAVNRPGADTELELRREGSSANGDPISRPGELRR